MAAITQSEFDRIVEELICTKPARYDALCAAAKKLVGTKLARKCAQSPALARVCTPEDLLSEVYIRLIKSAVPGFFFRTEEINLDIDGFCRWVYTIAGNLCIDYIKVSSSRYTLPIDAPLDDDEFYLQIPDPDAEAAFCAEPDIDTLRAAFEAVLDMDIQVYKALTWIAQAVLILSEDVSKIESNALLVERYENMTLEEMWASVRRCAQNIPWMKISKESEERLRKIFLLPFNESRRYGEMKYSDFYMKKGAKASISDWVNRINAGLRRKLYGTSEYT